MPRGGVARKTITLKPKTKTIKLDKGMRKLKVRNIDEVKVTNEDLRVNFAHNHHHHAPGG